MNNQTNTPMARALQFLKWGGLTLLKGVVAAIATLVGLVLGGLLTRALNLPTPVVPAYMNMATLMPLMFLSDMVVAMVLGECFQRLFPRYWPRLLGLWLCTYVLYYLLNLLDGLLFSPMPNMSTGVVLDLVPALFAAAVIAWLWRPASASPTDRRLADYFSARRPGSWAWRFAAAWLCFPPLYYLAGRVVAVFTLSYYQNHQSDLGLTLNFTLPGLMAMQVLRGALFLLAVLPIIFAWKGSRPALWLQVGLVIFTQIAIQTVLQAYWLPFRAVRVPHGLELLVDSFVQAGVYAWLLCPPAATVTAPGLNRGLDADAAPAH